MKHFMKKIEWLLNLGGIKKDVVLLAVSGIALLFSIFPLRPIPFDAAWIAIVFCGLPIILEAVVGLVTQFDIKADVLVSLALIASVCIGEIFAAGEVAFIMQLGGLLEELTVARARAGIEKLVHLTPQTARILTDGAEKIIPAEQVKVGDVLRVLPGETVPVDGTILSGQTSVNQAVMTGESLPVDKTVGEEVSSGTVNQYGAFEMKAAKVGEDSSIQRMIRLVQSADAGKGQDRRPCGPLGNLDRRDRSERGRAYLADFRKYNPCSDDSRCVLPLLFGACNADGDYGGDRECNKTRVSGARGRRAGAPCKNFCHYL